MLKSSFILNFLKGYQSGTYREDLYRSELEKGDKFGGGLDRRKMRMTQV